MQLVYIIQMTIAHKFSIHLEMKIFNQLNIITRTIVLFPITTSLVKQHTLISF